MSTQPQQQQQQQPVVVYPNPVTSQFPPSHSSHSNGSFGTAFIVLAVIVVVSAIACCLGRLCSKRQHKQKPNNKQNHQSHTSRPREREREREHHDLEFGFEKGFPTARTANNGDPRGHKPSGINGYMNGHARAETNHPVDVGEPKVAPML